MIRKIISGGQTGVDRAALDVALKLNIPCGGWCPKGRRAEDGEIDAKYPLTETESRDYVVRTELNVQNSDGTLILYDGHLMGGTALTVDLAVEHCKPHLVVNFEDQRSPDDVRQWINDYRFRTLNVAGPRNDRENRIYELAYSFLERLFSAGEPTA